MESKRSVIFKTKPLVEGRGVPQAGSEFLTRNFEAVLLGARAPSLRWASRR